jgi:hypothetical protein
VTRFITIAEFWWLAEQVTGMNADVLGKSGSHNLADSHFMPLKPASVVKTSTLT